MNEFMATQDRRSEPGCQLEDRLVGHWVRQVESMEGYEPETQVKTNLSRVQETTWETLTNSELGCNINATVAN